MVENHVIYCFQWYLNWPSLQMSIALLYKCPNHFIQFSIIFSSIGVMPVFSHKQSWCILSLFLWLHIHPNILISATPTFFFLVFCLWRSTFITIKYCWSYGSTIKLSILKEKWIKKYNTMWHLEQEMRPWFLEMELDCICDMRWDRATFVMETRARIDLNQS